MWVVIGTSIPAIRPTSVDQPDVHEITVPAEMGPRFVSIPVTRPFWRVMPSTRVYGWISTPSRSASLA